MLAHVPFFGRNPRGSRNFLAYLVPKACMHVLGTGVPRCWGVARSASSPKAALALGCSLTAGSTSRVAGSPAWHRLPQCPGYGHWISYCCVVFVFGSGIRCNPANPGWGLGWVCLGTGFGSAPPFLAGVCGVCGWAWVLACIPPILVWVLRPAWLCACSACTPPFPARVCGVGVCASARVLAAPSHSWLGCLGVCVFVCALLLYPATPGWAVRCACVCWGSGCGCAPSLLAGVLGCVCVCLRAQLVPRHSWLGCECGFVCLGLGLGCAPPLLAGVLGGVFFCVCAPLLPRHSWLGFAVGVCVSRLGFLLRPAIPGSGVGVCVCVFLRALFPARHFWLGYAVWVCVLGLGFRLLPATPGWDVRVCVCLRALSACTPPLLAGVCNVAVCAWARVSAAPCHSWLGCSGVCVFECALCLYPATPGWGVQCRCVCLGSGFGCALPLLARVLGWMCVCV